MDYRQRYNKKTMIAVNSPIRQFIQATVLVTIVTGTSAISAAPDEPSSGSDSQKIFAHWDWLPAEELGDEQPCRINTGCEGAYRAPAADWPESDQKAESAPLRAGASQSEMADDRVILTGDVVLTKGNRKIEANTAQLNRLTNILTLQGDVSIREPNLLLRCDQGLINTDTGIGEYTNIDMLNHLSGIRITAQGAKRATETTLEFKAARYTQCTPNDEAWVMDAEKINLNRETGWGSANNMVIRVKGIPVFYSPYITFPIDERRKTGFLWPTIASNDGGLDLSTPYYLNLAPSLDATVTPRKVAHHGNLLEAQVRYLNEYSYWQLGAAQIGHDDITGEKRWLGNLQARGAFNEYWNHKISYTKVSDSDYFRDLSINSLSASRATHLNQSAHINFQSQDWKGQLLLETHQTIDELIAQPYQRLPQLTLQNQASAKNFSPDFILLAEFTEFDHNEAIDKGGRFVTGQRSYAETGLSFPMSWAPGFIIPTAKVKHVTYRLDGLSDHKDDKPSTTVPSVTLDMGLIFERPLSFANNQYTQTLEPRIYQLYSGYKEQLDQPDFDSRELSFSYNQLFRDSRFSGHDRLDDANQTSLGITSRFIDDNSGLETLSLSVGQTFYWDDRKVQKQNNQDPETPSNSAIAAEISYHPHQQFWFNSTALWDSRQDKMNEFGISTQYSVKRSLWNAAYRFKRDDDSSSRDESLEQADISTAIAINDRWKLLARFQYDVKEDRSLEDLFGIEYEDCCWLTRIVYQRAVKKRRNSDDDINNNLDSLTNTERDHKIVLQFQLKGLGGIGNKAANILKESILGY